MWYFCDGTYLNCKHTHSSNDIQGIPENAVTQKCWVKFPNGSHHLHICNLCYNGHNVDDSEVDDMHKAWKAMLEWVEWVHLAFVEKTLHSVARCIIVACIVSCDTKQLIEILSVAIVGLFDRHLLWLMQLQQSQHTHIIWWNTYRGWPHHEHLRCPRMQWPESWVTINWMHWPRSSVWWYQKMPLLFGWQTTGP